ncbi:MAG: TrkH family potassium uptake protein [Acidobacteriota bacterium]
MSFRPVLRILGRLLQFLALAELLPVVVCVAYGEPRSALAFSVTAIVTGGLGTLLRFFGRGATSQQLFRREGILIVVGGWMLASLSGAAPFLLAGTVTSPVDALFESASGFTTTGASILTDIESADHGILFWRSFSQWLGGMGIIVLFVALLPELGPGARFLYRLEVPGPTAETFHPKVHDTAVVLWRLYLLLTTVQILLLLLGGLDLYDAATHTFSTLSTGGFSPRNESMAAFDSPFVQIVVIVFMVLAGANFSLYYLAWRGRNLRVFGDTELRIYLALIVGTSALIGISLIDSDSYSNAFRAGLDATFQVVSIITTTGFATADFDTWPGFAKVLLVALMFTGGCAGSTAGGPKIMRMVIGLRTAWREVRDSFSPNTVSAVFVGGKPVPEPVLRTVAGFFILYVSTWALGTVLLTLGGQSLLTSSTAAIATLGNIGPGLELVGPTGNFAFWSDAQKLLMVLLMWIGRLEVYAIMAVFTVAFWRR